MEDKLIKRLYNFLLSNRVYNKAVQEKFYISVVTPYKTKEEKIIALLYNIANTQSQPRIDLLAKFFQDISKNKSCLASFESFISYVSSEKEKTYKNLYKGLIDHDGWGGKTSALFTKSIYHIHNGEYRSDLKIWNDVPAILENDDFYLPVDSVIIVIFKKLNKEKNWNFESINKTLKDLYKTTEIEVWDDLWFWGFITQKGGGSNRIFEWNENKYWMMKESDKRLEVIQKIKIKAQEFLDIIGEKGDGVSN